MQAATVKLELYRSTRLSPCDPGHLTYVKTPRLTSDKIAQRPDEPGDASLYNVCGTRTLNQRFYGGVYVNPCGR